MRTRLLILIAVSALADSAFGLFVGAPTTLASTRIVCKTEMSSKIGAEICAIRGYIAEVKHALHELEHSLHVREARLHAKAAKAPKGLRGVRGAVGPVGPRGATGEQGYAIALSGPQGVSGATGPEGPQGREGRQGPTGPVGGTLHNFRVIHQQQTIKPETLGRIEISCPAGSIRIGSGWIDPLTNATDSLEPITGEPNQAWEGRWDNSKSKTSLDVAASEQCAEP